MNIATSATSTPQAQAQDTERINGIPVSFFLNFQALQTILKHIKAPGAMLFSIEAYRNNLKRLKLSLYYLDRTTNPPSKKIAVEGSEGPFAFPIIEPGFEDTYGVAVLVKRYSVAPVMPRKAIAAMLMVDFWNPLYSARREKLMQYLPETASFNPATSSYDLLDQFIANVNASSSSHDQESPEYEILQLLNTPDSEWNQKFTDRINAYLDRVVARLNNPEDHGQAAIDEYMVLAEGRRRLYRGREDSKPDGSGLNEFMLTLPSAASPDPFPITKMTETGDVVVMPEDEIVFLETRGGMRAKRAMRVCPAHLHGSRAGLCL
ncbi:hypothetical protein RhiJN_05716 [Ceratobasidium sp. AG-Ba]|nr:hypothetical protein RhiJN_05716 [Ceratobasidium sp. AG-Ba]QRW06646.1 hypothetical protein RhiLY_05645 [Ceratobasidium sp. AG-Ba]